MSGGVTIFNGNPGIRIDSTEVYSDNAWSFVGKLPATMWGMSATSLNNKVLLFGNNKIYIIPLIIGPCVSDSQVDMMAPIQIRYSSLARRLKNGQ